MLEVYDRVLMSRNINTLLMLALIALALLAIMEWLNKIRVQLLTQIGDRLFRDKRETLFEMIFIKGVRTNQPFNPLVMDHLNKVVTFISSAIFLSLLDLPFSLIFLGVIYLISPFLGTLTLVVTIFLIIISIVNEQKSHPELQKANQSVYESQVLLNNVLKNAEVIKAMGMSQHIEHLWKNKHFEYLSYQSRASLVAVKYAAYAKLLQQILGSAILGLGCYLFLKGNFPIGPAGFIIASILAARFTGPVVQILTGWKNISGAYDSVREINRLIDEVVLEKSTISLPIPKGDLAIENVSVRIANTDRVILNNISFALKVGQSVAIIGPSGSGKSTLAKLIVGALKPDNGSVRLDGAELYRWDKAEVGTYIGYLSQEVDLYQGTIKENIARFNPASQPEKIDACVRQCRLQDFIAELPEQGNTYIGPEGVMLPGGKKQLVGLARALFGNPKLVLLDEPNSNLDKEGELALVEVIQHLKQQAITTVLITHQKSYLALVDFIIVLINGEVKLSGTAKDVLSKLQPAAEIAKNTTEELQS